MICSGVSDFSTKNTHISQGTEVESADEAEALGAMVGFGV